MDAKTEKSLLIVLCYTLFGDEIQDWGTWRRNYGVEVSPAYNHLRKQIGGTVPVPELLSKYLAEIDLKYQAATVDK